MEDELLEAAFLLVHQLHDLAQLNQLGLIIPLELTEQHDPLPKLFQGQLLTIPQQLF